jgi:hypothetical protein
MSRLSGRFSRKNVIRKIKAILRRARREVIDCNRLRHGDRAGFTAMFHFLALHLDPLGFYIPAQKRSRKEEIEAMRAAAKELDAMIADWGTSEDELMREYKEIRRAGRERKRNSK